MRLLERHNGDFRLTDDLFDGEIPPYAILSHTWGSRPDEVTFKDMIEGTGRQKPGYHKIRFCGEEAAKDGLEFFWVDSCCIDKSSSAELQEAITSMFRWYLRAAKCYVYLADVSMVGMHRRVEWEPAFRNSRWFTRGWTLQEMIAAPVVEFFSREGKRLGDKDGLEDLLHTITGVNAKALRGEPLSHFDVAERLSWARSRNTTRPEDQAYCLLGIFGVFIPIMYGEGKQSAINRLEEQLQKTTASVSPINADRQKHNLSHTSPSRGQDIVDGAKGSPVHDRTLTLLDVPSRRPLSIAQNQHELQQRREEAMVKAPLEQKEARQGQKDKSSNELGPGAETAQSEIIEHRWATRRVLKGHSEWASHVAFAPDGRTLASISADQEVRVWDCWSGAMIRSLQFEAEARLAFTANSKFLAIRWGRGVALWDMRTLSMSRAIRTAETSWLSVACSPDGTQLAIATEVGTVELWGTKSGKLLRTYATHLRPFRLLLGLAHLVASKPICDLKYSPDGSMLACGTGKPGPWCWNIREGVEMIKDVTDGTWDPARSVAFSSNSQLLATGSDRGDVTLWQCSPGVKPHRLQLLWQQTPATYFKTDNSSLVDLAFAPGDGLLIVGFWGNTVRFFNCRTGDVVRMFEKRAGTGVSPGSRPYLSPDGSILAATISNRVLVWT